MFQPIVLQPVAYMHVRAAGVFVSVFLLLLIMIRP
jgi:hypothetical protein